MSSMMRLGLATMSLILLSCAGMMATAKAVVIVPMAGRVGALQSTMAQPYGPVYKVGDGVSMPSVLESVDAEFPESAIGKEMKEAVVVNVDLIVDKEGMPREVLVAHSSSTNEKFGDEAVKAVKQYRFKPAEKAGAPVAVSIVIEVMFKRY
jgi:TonB family protein